MAQLIALTAAVSDWTKEKKSYKTNITVLYSHKLPR
jgi:hypothetical protein